ncbi:MAG: hypothetical protein WCO97_09445, partial [bacterium]
LGFVELDRGEDDLRQFVSQVLSCLMNVVTDDDWYPMYFALGEPITVEVLLERLEWCVASDPAAAKRFPEWAQLDDLERLESTCRFVEETLRDYRLRLLEITDTEEPVLEEMPLPPADCLPRELLFFPPLLTVDDHEFLVTEENADEIRDWLLEAIYSLGSKLPEQQISHMVDAFRFSDALCPVSKAQWIPGS